MTSPNNLLHRLSQRMPSDDRKLCQELQARAVEVLAGEKISEALQEHRESCLSCLSHLKGVMDQVKASLPEIRGVHLWRVEELGHAAGSTESWRSIHESQITGAGFSSGWHLDVQIDSEDQYRLTLVSDLTRRVRITLLTKEGEALEVLELSKMPSYLARSTAELSHCFVLEELD
jgi:hypothetical protein